jgi:hypothetical protein
MLVPECLVIVISDSASVRRLFAFSGDFERYQDFCAN